MDNNLLLIGRLALGGGVLDRDLTTQPGSPNSGDAYIVATGGTGDWVGQDSSIAIYDDGSWIFITPPNGYGIFIIDESVWSIYKSGSGWSAGVGHTWS